MAAESTTQVLEFDLGPDRYCVDIEYVSQIVEEQAFTPLPNAPEHVKGVIDLRGETTTIIDPKELFDIDADDEEDHIVVFDPDELDSDAVLGWQIDSVHQVSEITPEDIERSPVEDQEGIHGLINRGDEFVIWISPLSETEA